VRKLLSFLVIGCVLVTGCRQNANPVVAEAFHKKLYLSEVKEKIPYSVSKEDSLIFLEKYVEEWVLHQTLLTHAHQKLTQKEQNFSTQIEHYKEQLLINAYFQKISKNPALFEISKEELAVFLNETKTEEEPEYRDMVKLNYVRLSNPSKLYKKIKELFFDDQNRAKALAQIELLCADTIEYYLDSEHWFYADFIERELPISFSDVGKKGMPEKLDIALNGNRYLIIILEQKQQLQPRNVSEDKKMALLLLQQQKQAAFIANYQDSLVNKALQERKVVKYPIPW
jgi:hypothetical protein